MFFVFNLIMPLHAVVLNTEKTAVVDLEQVFEEYYKTKASRKDIETKRTQLRDSLLFKQKAITELESKYNAMISTETSKQNMDKTFAYDILKSTDTLPDPKKTGLNESKNMPDINQDMNKPESKEGMNRPASDTMKTGLNDLAKSTTTVVSIVDLKKQIDDAKKEIKEYEEKMTRDIDKLEKDYLYNITGEVYEKISFVSRKCGYNVVFDKKEMVYSTKGYDLTDMVIKELNL